MMNCKPGNIDLEPCYLLQSMKEVRLSFNFHYGSKQRFYDMEKEIIKDPLTRVIYYKHPYANKGKFTIQQD